MTLAELSRLDYDGAMQLLLAYATDIKTHDRDIEAVEKEIALWSSRVSLAEGKGLADLAAGAKEQAARLQARAAGIRESKAELERDVARIKEALPGIKARQRSIDPDLLQAELAMMTGEALDPEKAKMERELNALATAASGGTAGSPGTRPVAASQGSDGTAAGNPPLPDDPLTALKRKMGLIPPAQATGTQGGSGIGDAAVSDADEGKGGSASSGN